MDAIKLTLVLLTTLTALTVLLNVAMQRQRSAKDEPQYSHPIPVLLAQRNGDRVWLITIYGAETTRWEITGETGLKPALRLRGHKSTLWPLRRSAASRPQGAEADEVDGVDADDS